MRAPVVMQKCGLVVSKEMPVFAATPDGKVIDFGCGQPFGKYKLNVHQQNLLSLRLILVLIQIFFCQGVGD